MDKIDERDIGMPNQARDPRLYQGIKMALVVHAVGERGTAQVGLDFAADLQNRFDAGLACSFG